MSCGAASLGLQLEILLVVTSTLLALALRSLPGWKSGEDGRERADRNQGSKRVRESGEVGQQPFLGGSERCPAPSTLHVLLSNQTSLTKHKFKDNIRISRQQLHIIKRQVWSPSECEVALIATHGARTRLVTLPKGMGR